MGQINREFDSRRTNHGTTLGHRVLLSVKIHGVHYCPCNLPHSLRKSFSHLRRVPEGIGNIASAVFLPPARSHLIFGISTVPYYTSSEAVFLSSQYSSGATSRGQSEADEYKSQEVSGRYVEPSVYCCNELCSHSFIHSSTGLPQFFATRLFSPVLNGS